MSRSTLKLPVKTTRPAAAEERRSPSRKPIRGASPTARKSAPRRDDKPTTPSALPAAAKPKGRSVARPSSVTVPAGDFPKRRNPPAPAGSSTPVDEPASVAYAKRARQDETRIEKQADSAGRRDSRSASSRQGDPTDLPPKKAYPPRGVARSTGARALPPVPHRREDVSAAGRQADRPPTSQPPRTAALDAPANVGPASLPRGQAKQAPRLSKLVSQSTNCSRREADEWIENGWVKVDGAVVNRLGARVHPKAKIEILSAASRHPVDSVTILFHQPSTVQGEAVVDSQGPVSALISAENRWPDEPYDKPFTPSHLRALAPAGRLAGDIGGLVAFTQEGNVARRLTSSHLRLEHEYHVRVDGQISPDGLETLRHGLMLDGRRQEPVQTSWLSDRQLRFVTRAGRSQPIRQMLAQVGLHVTDIKRVRIGGVSLGRLPPGQWRYLRPDERF